MNTFRKLVKYDCDQLLNKFQETGSVRFDAFSQIWKEMKFEQIFYGTVRHESRSFSRLVLDTAYDFLQPPFTFQIRVGGLYLLYSLFHCQTADPPEKIRLALKDWDEMQKFEKDSFEAQHFDIVYVLRKLLHEKAFVFTAMPRHLQFERKKVQNRAPVCESFMEKPSAPQTLINNDLLEELSNVHGLYEKLKSSLSPRSDSSLNLTHQNLVQNLRGTVLDFYGWQQNKAGSSRDEDCGEGTSAQQEISSKRADLLASIKSRAYGEAAEVTKSRRHRAVEIDHVTNPEPEGTSSRLKKQKLKSLRYRSTSKFHVSGHLLKDTVCNTDIFRLTTLSSDEITPRSFKKFKFKTENIEF